MKRYLHQTSPGAILACLCACVISVTGCSGDPDPSMATPDQGSSKGDGVAGGPCYGNGTCNEGLVCVAATCEVDGSGAQDMRAADMSPDAPGDMPGEQDLGEPLPDASGDMPGEEGMRDMGESEEDMAPPAREEVRESEPNNGAMLDEVDTMTTSQVAIGSIETPGDVDIWKVDVQPGEIYRIKLVASDTSSLEEHLTVLDAGRGADAAGEDYVKIAQQFEQDPHATLTLFGMGTGGYYLVVRDARNVGPQMSQEGSASHTYSLYLEPLLPEDVQGKPLLIEASDITDALSSPGDITVYPFTANMGDELVANLQATSKDELDARLFVYAEQEQSWIARQDNRTVDDVDPLLDAPLFASGKMWLIVENISPTASALGYTLRTRLSAP